jgi:hypothetical protein
VPPGQRQWEGELEQLTRNGRQLAVASRWARRRDQRGEFGDVLAINSDVTKRQLGQAVLSDVAASEPALKQHEHLLPHDLARTEDAARRCSWSGRCLASAGRASAHCSNTHGQLNRRAARQYSVRGRPLETPSRPDDQHPVSLPDRPPPYESWHALFACGSQSVMVDPTPSPWLSARSLPPWASAI